MLSSDRLDALLAVVEAGSFQGAARTLHVSQSAISQRIAAFEEEIGSPLLARTTPVTATTLGRRILQHAVQVREMERELRNELFKEDQTALTRVTIAVNADSVATWFLEAMQGFLRGQMKEESLTLLELKIANEERTYEMVRRGEAFACVTAAKISLPGCERLTLGSMRYLAAATPGFARRFFLNGLTREAVAKAPAVVFDAVDSMHDRFLRAILRGAVPEYPRHFVPTAEGFTAMVVRGLAYGVIGELQAPRELASGRLLSLAPGHEILVPLYWYYPRRESRVQRVLREELTAAARRSLLVVSDIEISRGKR